MVKNKYGVRCLVASDILIVCEYCWCVSYGIAVCVCGWKDVGMVIRQSNMVFFILVWLLFRLHPYVFFSFFKNKTCLCCFCFLFFFKGGGGILGTLVWLCMVCSCKVLI